ncbi:MAG: phospholipase C, phosphocholine-specific [Alphaproteobacteria bacterium]|nr:phospholipase C, phosphocholine-specific [Alphaproteobacteria bacterium]
MTDRRTFLKLGAAAALLPPNLRSVLAAPAKARTGTIQDVEHVVIFMQENRSFDHYFGTLKGVRGFSDPRAIALPGGNPVWMQLSKSGETFTPFHLDTSQTAAQCMASLDHSWKGSHELWKNHDAWIDTKTRLTMGYFTRADLPFYHALADAFTICDAYHCSVWGPTTPNRLHLWSGTSGLTVDHDRWAVANPDETNETADLRNDTKAFDAFEWRTCAEALQKAHVSWRVYQEYDNYGDNGLAYFKAFRGHGRRHLMERARAWVEGSNKDNAKTSRGEHLVKAFAQDVATDRLPQVSWIVAPTIMCEHPSATPGYGESLTFRLLDALTANPSVWAKTAFILNYDENDGFFDHMPPPNPPLTPDLGASTVAMTGESYRGIPFGFGPRVPAMVVSPWTVGGFVNSELFDHTSVLRFLEMRFGVAAPNISPWRRALAGDLTSVFDFTQAAPPAIPPAGDPMRKADRQCKLDPPHYSREDLPRQERGRRPARPLPYDIEVGGKAVPGGFALDFVNRGSAGAAFRVATDGAGPWFFTVEAGRTLGYTLPRNGAYDFSVLGPNGFLRRFKGDGSGTIEAGFQTAALTVRNNGSEPATVRNGYDDMWRDVVLPGETRQVPMPLHLAATANWYDMSVACGAHLQRFAGHVEDGKPSLSDPLLGVLS